MLYKKKSFITLFSIIIIVFFSVYITFNTHSSSNEKTIIFAASSLQPALDDVEKNFKNKLLIQYNGSQILKHQIENGANADIFFCATQEKCLADYIVYPFCSNKLVLSVKKELFLNNITDAVNKDFSLAYASKEVPLGLITNKYLLSINQDDAKAIIDKMITNDLSASSVVNRMVTGQVDGGFIYKSYVVNNIYIRQNFKNLELKYDVLQPYFFQILSPSLVNSDVHKHLISFVNESNCLSYGYEN
ncbi:MAG: substrate-binding domain-containing protein [Dehalococcoidia bacterium]|nr:substrate-binding domain-containing protein [Dehalococcoidia bacterium]